MKITRDIKSKLGVHGPWFGRLINSNRKKILNEPIEKINNWFNKILSSNSNNIVNNINILSNAKNELHLNGANVGLITLMLYLRDKASYSLWFEGHHKALQELYPKIGDFSRSGNKYLEFNMTIKSFARDYAFQHSELDFILANLRRMT